MPLPPDGEAQPGFRDRFSVPRIPYWRTPPHGARGPRRGRGSASRVRRRPLPRVLAFPARLWSLSGSVQGRPLWGPPLGTPTWRTVASAAGPSDLGGSR